MSHGSSNQDASPSVHAIPLNGRVCCLLDLPCCGSPPGMTQAEAQVDTLAYVIQKALVGAGFDGLDLKSCYSAARAILEHADLVPKGVGKAMAEMAGGYQKFLTPPRS